MSNPAAHAAEAAGAHAEGPGEIILHHIMDTPIVEIPIGDYHLPITKHVVMMWIAMAILIALFAIVRRKNLLEPTGRLHNLLETFVVFVRDEVAEPNIGHEAHHYTPFLCTAFFFILMCNMLGMVPGAATATGNIGVTCGLALLTFFMTQFAGIRAHGFFGHWKNLVPHGVPLWLYPLMVPVELLGLFTKPFALCVRLFANMIAGHVVILALISLVFVIASTAGSAAGIAVGFFGSTPFALFIALLEVLVIVLQAYVFTMLSALFIGMAVHSH